MPKVGNKGNELVNRQAVGTYRGKLHQRQTGLLKKVVGDTAAASDKGIAGGTIPLPPKKKSGEGDPVESKGKKNDIRCEGEIVPLSSLTPDPNNARLHPERNLAAITESLVKFGQCTPLTVRKQDNVVAVGNGRLECIKALGWTKVAVSKIPMTDAEFADYSLADNRTAELARWDFEAVARLDKLITLAGRAPVGWTDDELSVLRAAEWLPPTATGGDVYEPENDKVKALPLTESQWEALTAAHAALRQRDGCGTMADGDCLELIYGEWYDSQTA